MTQRKNKAWRASRKITLCSYYNCIVAVETNICIWYLVVLSLFEVYIELISLFLCDFGKNGADSRHRLCHTQYIFVVRYFFLLTVFSVSEWLLLILTLYLCLCSSCSTLSTSTGPPGHLVSPAQQKAQQGLTPLGSDPHTHLAPHIHLFILWMSQVLSPPFPFISPFFLLCVPCVIFGRAEAMNRMSIFSSTRFFPKVFSVWVSLLNASVWAVNSIRYCFCVCLLCCFTLLCLCVAKVMSCRIVLLDVLLLVLLITTKLPKIIN